MQQIMRLTKEATGSTAYEDSTSTATWYSYGILERTIGWMSLLYNLQCPQSDWLRVFPSARYVVSVLYIPVLVHTITGSSITHTHHPLLRPHFSSSRAVGGRAREPAVNDPR